MTSDVPCGALVGGCILSDWQLLQIHAIFHADWIVERSDVCDV